MREGAKSVRKGRFVMIIKASIAQLWKTIGTNIKDNGSSRWGQLCRIL